MPKKVDRPIHNSGLLGRIAKKEIMLFMPFMREPWKGFTISEIKSITRNNSHHYVFDAMKRMAKASVVKEECVGNSMVYSLNYESALPIHLLCFAESLVLESRKDIPAERVAKVMENISNPYFTMLIGGSYASGKQRKDSDIDVAVIIPDSEKKRPYEIAMLRKGDLMIPRIHGFVFTREEFFLMLTNREFNYGKEIARKHVAIRGCEAYYEILFEAMRNGFKG